MTFLYGIPPVLLLVIAIAIAVALACTGQIIVHRRFKMQDFVRHNDVAGFMIAVVGTLYAVVLGFLTVIVWQHFSDAGALVASESAAALDAWHFAIGLPAPERKRVRESIQSYATIMVGQEWPAMRAGGFDKEADFALMHAIVAAGMTAPADLRESNAQAATIRQLGFMHDARQHRLSLNSRGVSGFEWLVLFIGAVCVIGFCWLFGLANPAAHLIMTSTVTTVVVAMLVLLFELQYPFRSPIGVANSDWVGVLKHIQMMQSYYEQDMRM